MQLVTHMGLQQAQQALLELPPLPLPYLLYSPFLPLYPLFLPPHRQRLPMRCQYQRHHKHQDQPSGLS
jgi:hypothetical protein